MTPFAGDFPTQNGDVPMNKNADFPMKNGDVP